MASLSYYKNIIEDYQIGEIIALPKGSSTPEGFLKCDGNVVSQTTYSSLYNKIGLISDEIISNLTPWSIATTGIGTDLHTIMYGNGLYVAAGFDGTVITSTDAVTWSTQNPIAGLPFISSSIFANNVYILGTPGAPSGTLYTSSNGTTWTARSTGLNSTRALTYIPETGLFIVGGSANGNNTIATSTDAISWTPINKGNNTEVVSLVYGNGTYVYSGPSGNVGYSYDLVTWTHGTTATGATQMNKLVYGKNMFLGITSTLNSYFTSKDGISWTRRFVSTSELDSEDSTWQNVTYGEGVFVLVGIGEIATSKDGIKWQIGNSGTISHITSISYGNNLMVFCTLGGTGQNQSSVGRKAISSYNISTEFKLPQKNPNKNLDLDFFIKAT